MPADSPSPQSSSRNANEISRLAPSPTGALHLGNVRTFLINWAVARQHGWRLVMRIEDLDTPRIKANAAAQLLESLQWIGIDWDKWHGLPPGQSWLVQSDDLEPYRAAMHSLASRGLAYPCQLTRAQIEAAASAPQEGAHDVAFPASLRPSNAGQSFDFDALDTAVDPNQRPNWRLLTPRGPIRFTDGFTGPQTIDPSTIVGDFVLWTRRGQPSYQLAVVVDDHRQSVTQVIRGNDLLDSAARQLALYRFLGYSPEPTYTHLPLVIGEDGHRLAKRHGDTRVDYYRSRGVPPEAVIGLIARWSGITDQRQPCSAKQFLQAFNLSTLPLDPVTFTTEDDQWLLSQALPGR